MLKPVISLDRQTFIWFISNCEWHEMECSITTACRLCLRIFH